MKGVLILETMALLFFYCASTTLWDHMEGPLEYLPYHSHGYIDLDYSSVGNKIKIEVRGKKHNAKISQLPFYKKSYVK